MQHSHVVFTAGSGADGPTVADDGSNRSVGQQLYRLMADHNQEIPEWFEAECGGRGRGPKAGSPSFGGRDVRGKPKVRNSRKRTGIGL